MDSTWLLLQRGDEGLPVLGIEDEGAAAAGLAVADSGGLGGQRYLYAAD